MKKGDWVGAGVRKGEISKDIDKKGTLGCWKWVRRKESAMAVQIQIPGLGGRARFE